MSRASTCGEGGVKKFAWPTFDHAKGDPEFGQEVAVYQNGYVVVEGLYLLLWPEVAKLLDVVLVMGAAQGSSQPDAEQLEACIARLKKRNLCLPGYTEEEVVRRCDEVDRANAIKVLESISEWENKLRGGIDSVPRGVRI